MTITFWCPDAPTARVEPYPEDEPGYFEERSTLPELNLANSNARALLEMLQLGHPEDYCGSVALQELPGLLAKIDSALAAPVERAAFLEPAYAQVSIARLAREVSGQEAPLALGLALPAPVAQVAREAMACESAPPGAHSAQAFADAEPTSQPSLNALLAATLGIRPAQAAAAPATAPGEKSVLYPGGPILEVVERGPTVVYPGRSDDYLTARLQQLRHLVVQAQAHGFAISWG